MTCRNMEIVRAKGRNRKSGRPGVNDKRQDTNLLGLRQEWAVNKCV